MSKKTKIKQLNTIYEQFKALDFDNFFTQPGNYVDWEGLDFEEFQTSVEYIITTYNEAFKKDIFNKLAFAPLNALVNSLNNAKSHCISLLTNKQQVQFQQAAQSIDSVVHQLMSYDVNFYLVVGTDLEEVKNIYEIESQKLTVYNADIEKLKGSVESLIEPAVAGSLSQSFSKRKKSLFYGRIAWGILSIVFAIIAIVATYNVSHAVIDSLKSKQAIEVKQTKSEQLTVQHKQDIQEESFSLILLRAVVLVPIYLGFGFAFSQYRKERELEEEYAHKEAVATTLPNYGDLAKDDGVKDQIVTGASNVIFESPIYRTSKNDKNIDVIDSLRNLFDSAGKAFKREE